MKWDVYVRNINKPYCRLVVRVDSISEAIAEIAYQKQELGWRLREPPLPPCVYYVRQVKDEGSCEWCASLFKKADEFSCNDLWADLGVTYTYCGDGAKYTRRAKYCPICGKRLTNKW